MKKGFTLIELLVVMSIIGILAALTLTGFGAARKNARDTNRKSDLAQYKAALEAYAANNNGLYPDATDDCNGGSCNGNSYTSTGDQSGIFVSGATYPIIPGYLPTLIQDPTGTTKYRYEYRATANGQDHVLWAELETGKWWELCSNGKAGLASTEPTSVTCTLP